MTNDAALLLYTLVSSDVPDWFILSFGDTEVISASFASIEPAAVAVTIPARVTLKELSPTIQRHVPSPIAS